MADRTAQPSSTGRAAPARGPAAGARPPGPKARLLGHHGLTLLPVGGGWLLGQLGQLGQPLLAQLPETRLPHPATPLQPIHQRLRDGQVAVPLAVGRDDRPGGLGGAATVQGLLVGDGVVLPAVAFLPVVGGELVGLLDVLFAGEQPLALLLLGDVQEELADDGAAVDQQPLEVVDLLVTLLPDLAGDELVDAHDQDVLVVGPVEDADHAVGGGAAVDAPEEVVVQLDLIGSFERGDLAALRIDAGEDLADGAVLDAGGVELLLEVGEPGGQLGGALDAVGLAEAAVGGGIDGGQPDLLARLDRDAVGHGHLLDWLVPLWIVDSTGPVSNPRAAIRLPRSPPGAWGA